MLLKEPHCLGFGEPKEQTVRQWLKDQDLEVYNQMNDQLLEIISLKNRLHPGPLDLKSQHLFYNTLYDPDHFRNEIFNNKLFDSVDVGPQKLTAARTDDTVLLEIGIEWVKQAVFKF